MKKFNAQEEDKILREDVEKILKFQADDILKEITELFKMAQHNKNITKMLMERIDAANSAILRSDDLDYNNLQRLVQVLQSMKKFIEKIT